MKKVAVTSSLGAALGPAEASGGWAETPVHQVRAMQAQVSGLKRRMQQLQVNSMPAAVRGYRVFQPEAGAIVLPAAFAGLGAPVTVNYVVRDGVTHDVPARITGPGTFVAERMAISVSQRQFLPGDQEARQRHMPLFTAPFVDDTGVLFPYTPKICLVPTVPQVYSANMNPPFPLVSFFWNLVDNRSNRALANDLMGDVMLGTRTHYNFNVASNTQVAPDGAWYEFDTPWAFQSGGQVVMQFRPITPVLQYDSSVNLAGALGYDDRENGIRNQAVTVTFELHGYRFDSDLAELDKGDLGKGIR